MAASNQFFKFVNFANVVVRKLVFDVSEGFFSRAGGPDRHGVRDWRSAAGLLRLDYAFLGRVYMLLNRLLTCFLFVLIDLL